MQHLLPVTEFAVQLAARKPADSERIDPLRFKLYHYHASEKLVPVSSKR